MKAFALAAVVLGVAVLAVLPTLAGGSTSDVRVTCNTGAIDIYFWPHGHPVVPAYKFTRYAPPHLEVYRRGAPVSKNMFLFVSNLKPKFNYANTCDLATDPRSTVWGGGPKTTVTATRRVRCRFPQVVHLKVIPTTTVGKLVVLRGKSAKEVLTATLKARGSSLTYDSRYCLAVKVPGVA